MSSEPPEDRATTPHNELLALTQQLTPSKTPRSRRQICQEIQSLANDATESHGAIKRKLVDVTNQLSNPRPPRKRRMRHNRSAQAADDVENPATLEDRVRATGRHFVIEYGLFLFTDVHALLDTDVDPSFNEATEFDSEDSRNQGQLRDVIALLPGDAKAIQSQDWIADSFGDGMSDGNGIDVKDFESSASRFNAFAKKIGYQEATGDAAAFYSPLKAEILFEEYDGTMNTTKIFRGPLLLKSRVTEVIQIYASIIRGLHGAKGLFEGRSKLPPAKVIQRLYNIECTTATS
ncbi:hypothetical protein B0H14DRAFT_2589440 [Mycena olivaceomarginata]|nr:hypothetical protein B0H14DRAFT_2589440 [Mycena olivaceomarginata]